MVNQQKTKCQLRLEARSMEYNELHEMKMLNLQSELEEKMRLRIAKATEQRIRQQRQRKACARDRVIHAQKVAKEQHAKRREETRTYSIATRKRLEIARQRRREKLDGMKQLCKQRGEMIMEKVENIRESQLWRQQAQMRSIENQLVDAARRREEQYNKMVQKLSQRWRSVELIKDRVQSVKVIQRWFRHQTLARKTALAVQTIPKEVLSVVQAWEEVAMTSFESSMLILQRRDLCKAAHSVVRIITPPDEPCYEVQPKKQTPAGKSGFFRVFLMAGMIAAHPDDVMEHKKCENLSYASRALVRKLKNVSTELSKGEWTSLKRVVTQMQGLFRFYIDAFFEWKSQDAERLAGEMLQSYRDIYLTKLSYNSLKVEHEADGMHQLRMETEKQIAQLRSAIMQVLGRADGMSKMELVEKSAEHEYEARSNANEPEQEDQQEAQLDVDEKNNSSSPTDEVMSLLGDENLAHELIINPKFRLSGDNDSLTSRVKEAMLNAFWDQIIFNNDKIGFIARLNEFKTLFASTVGINSSLAQEVHVALNSEVMEEFLRNPIEKHQACRERLLCVLQAILKAESPARNEATEAFIKKFSSASSSAIIDENTQMKFLVEFAAFIFAKVDLIRLDTANLHLGALALYLARHGVEYEQAKVAEKIRNGNFQLIQTNKWLSSEMEHYWKTLIEDEKSRLHNGDSEAFSRFIRLSFMSLLRVHIEGKSGFWPESFHLDVDRMRDIRNMMDRVTIVASIVVLLQEHLVRRRLPVTRPYLNQISQNLNDLLKSKDITGEDIAAQILHHARQREVESQRDSMDIEQELQSFKERVMRLFVAENVVLNLFSSRVSSFIFHWVASEKKGEIHDSLTAFEADLEEAGILALRVAKHNETVYAKQYNQIIKEILTKL